MADIVQKLRAYRPRYGWPEEYSTVVEPTMNHVAADEIERLRAREARLREALTQIEKWTAEMTNYKTIYVGTMIRNKARAALGEEKK